MIKLPENPYFNKTGEDDTALRIGYNLGQLETLKAIYEWGDEPCPHYPYFPERLKRNCEQCWGELKQLTEIE